MTTSTHQPVSEIGNQNMSEYVQVNQKVFFAASDRNKDVILDQLRPFLEKATLGSGSGQHIYHFSKSFPNVIYQPTEYNTTLLPSIEAYADEVRTETEFPIKRALELDATNQGHWSIVQTEGQRTRQEHSLNQESNQALQEQRSYDLVLTTNVFHISPLIVTESIVRGAGQVLKPGYFIVYGPFKKDGTYNSESNREFDEMLRGRDASWGVRDIEAIEAVAMNEAKMKLIRIQDMPSNNYMLFFEKQH
ncbi:hypothetical protein BGW38_005136 [Lunasporangiospora selenospora]|uniref:DUF938 domain-containing protein n=1 Tax=Lunasporangiospora selenospora TaxID=979761 RepID=A0A9P6KHH4_9FUNG|nr:hypothetical protein BGW38_005136 [Lunasporangiospora selenospora]